MAKKIVYAEPVDYIPESVRKKLGLGEFAPDTTDSTTAKSSAKTPAKGTTKKSK